MASITNISTNIYGVVNTAVGTIVNDAAAATAQTIQLGFAPRHIAFHNVTDRISDEWFEYMGENNIMASLRGIALKLDADALVGDTNYNALWTNPAATQVNTISFLKSVLTGITQKLDADSGVTGTDYTVLWGYPAPNLTALRTAVIGLTTKLDADTGVTDTNYTALWTPSITPSLHTIAAGTRTLELTNGILVDADAMTFTLTAATMVASKTFYWVAHA